MYLIDGTSCADETVNTYLTTGRLPARDLTCQSPSRDREPKASLPAERANRSFLQRGSSP
ncbi:alpha/beta hydrolase [Streptomyces avidinii]|uniref:alpha/beta hydrolase n=1 Tax=Streptomyces avidinii TaxID=1895 RepID=UPI00227D96C7|nr:alpha/beta hydrolase [Streptomyces avidinii]